MQRDAALDLLAKAEAEINSVILGQEDLVRMLLVGLFTEIPYAFKGKISRDGRAGGCAHILLEGVPGVAKTLAVVAISSLIQSKFQRIQLTPDLMPADLLGTRILDPDTGSFRIERGPVFTNILLADEINRATPKTQSALLEAMQERQITIAEETFQLEDPFWVLATQNPIEQEGVYVLPEAQLDRFSMMLRVGYPSHDDELKILDLDLTQIGLEPLLTPQDVIVIRSFIREVYVSPFLREYIVRLGRATRNPEQFELQEWVASGISPRAYQHLLSLSKTVAFFAGRDHVRPIDVKTVVHCAFRHRIIRTVSAEASNISTDAILDQVLQRVSIP